MALTDSEIDAAKVPYGRNQYKISDGGGLYLLVKSSGKYWKLAYRFDGKQKSLALGVYPTVGIEQAREKRDGAKALLKQGVDPGEIRKQERMERQAANSQAGKSSSKPGGITQGLAALETAERKQLEARRLCILETVAQAKGYSMDEASLLSQLEAAGHTISADRLRTDLAWLSEQHAVQLKTAALWGIYLTRPGFDAAHGSCWIPGISRPAGHEQQCAEAAE